MLPSTLLDSLYETIINLGKKRFWFLIPGLILLVVILINGIAIVPEEPYQRLSENPFITRTDIHFRNNFQETLLLPLIAFFLRSTSPFAFGILCFVIIVGGYAMFAWFTFRRWGASQSLIFLTLLITSPLTTILLVWLGMPDGLTVALTVPFLFTNSVFLVFCLAVLGSMNHVTFLIAAIEIVILRWIARDRVGLSHALISAAGGLVGIILLRAFLAVNQIEVAPRSSFILTRSLWDWVKLNMVNLPLSTASLFNVQWLVILVCFLMFFKWDKRFYISVVIILIFNYGITFFSLDTTRVFSILSWGIFMMCIFHSYRLVQEHSSSSPEYQKQFLQALAVIGIISIFAPRYFSWAGEIHTTPFYEFIRQLIH